MTIHMTPERLVFVLNNQGMQVSSVERYRSLLQLCEDSDHELLDCFVKQLNEADKQEASAWLKQFTLIANGARGVTSSCPRIQRLARMTARPSPNNQSMNQQRQNPPPSRYTSPVPPTPPANAASAPVRNSAGQQTPESKDEHRRSAKPQYKLFGGKAAVVMELDALQSGLATVCIEIAPCVRPREYDWTKKIQFQLTRKELPQFVGMFAGAADDQTKIEFKAHGEEHDKNLRVTKQGAHWLLTVGQKKALHSVQVTAPDTYHLISLCLRALAQNDPHLDPQTIVQLCKLACTTVPV